MSATGAKDVLRPASEGSVKAARNLAEASGKRTDIPVRRSFVRDDDPSIDAPLARLVSTGGRGGAVPLKLLLALIWRCSAAPFETDILARQWALLLDLEKPTTLGARRITNALDVLKSEGLVELEKRRGESTVVTLLEESASGGAYSLPSTAYTRATQAERPAHIYFKVPDRLWTEGHVQVLSAAGVAMLLVFISERNLDGRPTWWSTTRFPDLFGLSPTIRSRGTTELEDRGLVLVKKELVSNSPKATFSRDRVRNTYQLIGDARTTEQVAAEKAEAARRRKSRARKRSVVRKRRATPS